MRQTPFSLLSASFSASFSFLKRINLINFSYEIYFGNIFKEFKHFLKQKWYLHKAVGFASRKFSKGIQQEIQEASGLFSLRDCKITFDP